jgi:adenosylmethionine-8-amino-7-oxononanoate aminotransferase
MYEGGLLCRLDDRGEPVIQLSPPLVADQEVLGRIVDIVGDAVEHAWGQVQSGGLDRL